MTFRILIIFAILKKRKVVHTPGYVSRREIPRSRIARSKLDPPKGPLVSSAGLPFRRVLSVLCVTSWARMWSILEGYNYHGLILSKEPVFTREMHLIFMYLVKGQLQTFLPKQRARKSEFLGWSISRMLLVFPQ